MLLQEGTPLENMHFPKTLNAPVSYGKSQGNPPEFYEMASHV